MNQWKLAKKIFFHRSSVDNCEFTIYALNVKWTISIRYHYKINLFMSKYTIVEVSVRCDSTSRCFFVTSQIERLPMSGHFNGTQFVAVEELGKKLLAGQMSFLFKFEFAGWIKREDFLIGYIDIFIAGDSVASAGLSQEATNCDSIQHFGTDLSSLIHKELFSDVTLYCGTEVFPAHKAILAARSPVFAAMLQNPMKEAQENVIVVRHVNPDIFRILLEYIYSDLTAQMKGMMNSTNACEILAAADLYALPGLKKAVAVYLRSVISEYNALSILTFADLYDADLKEDVLRFVSDKFDVLKTTQEWENL